MDLISVVIPTHNRRIILERAIQSVLNQTHSLIEIIVVNDGSTDDTLQYLKSLKDDRIKFFNIYPGKGGNHARNFGIRKAKGVYIAFLDDDDEWVDNKLEKQLEVFKNKEIGLVYTGATILYPHFNASYYNEPTKKGNLSNEIYFSNFIGTTSSVMVSKKVLNETLLFDEKLSALQDYDLWIRIAQKTQIGYVDSPLLKYYNYPSNNQITDNINKIKESVEIIYEKYDAYFQKLPEDKLMKRKANTEKLFGKRYFRNGDNKKARKHFIKSYKLHSSFGTILLYFSTFVGFKNVIKLRSIIDSIHNKVERKK